MTKVVQVYKSGQGKYTRMGTLIAAMSVTVIGAYVLSNVLTAYTNSTWLHYGIPVVVTAVIGLFVLWLINKPSTADFLIATEGEMKKVSWSSKKEIVGSTKVVIITSVLLAAILFGVDFLFAFLFKKMGILG